MDTGPSWQRRRSEFSHDWLKNVFLPALGMWMNILDDEVEDRQFEMEFLESRFREWPGRSEDARAIVRSFEKELSPRSLVSRAPLNRLRPEHKEWLGEVIHVIWKRRCRVDELVAEATARLDVADALFELLSNERAKRPGATLTELGRLRGECAEFQRACVEVGPAFSRFPSTIQVA